VRSLKLSSSPRIRRNGAQAGTFSDEVASI
jgi:hypothetical protein